MTFSLLAAVPSHGGTIIMEGAKSLLLAQQETLLRGGTFDFCYHSGATVSLVRNAIVAEFLARNADILLMLDADQALDTYTLFRMIDSQWPVVGCFYPKRYYDWNALASGGGVVDTSQLPLQALKFIGELEFDEAGKSHLSDGFGRAQFVGTGAMIIRREALTKMMGAYPDLKNIGFGTDAYPGLEENWGFFNPINRADGLPLSEDISFCHRWRSIGGEIWADVVARAVHVGRHPFVGSYTEYLAAVDPSSLTSAEGLQG